MAKNDKRIDLDLLLKRRGMTLEQYLAERSIASEEQFFQLLKSENLRTAQQAHFGPIVQPLPTAPAQVASSLAEVQQIMRSSQEESLDEEAVSLKKTAELVERNARRSRKSAQSQDEK